MVSFEKDPATEHRHRESALCHSYQVELELGCPAPITCRNLGNILTSRPTRINFWFAGDPRMIQAEWSNSWRFLRGSRGSEVHGLQRLDLTENVHDVPKRSMNFSKTVLDFSLSRARLPGRNPRIRNVINQKNARAGSHKARVTQRPTWLNPQAWGYWTVSGIGTQVHCRSVNISEGGMALSTIVPLSLGEEMQMQLTLPGHNISFSVKSIVCWLKSSHLGVRFVSFLGNKSRNYKSG
jgi:hypothetical protein